LPAGLGRFDVVTFAQSFHWMERRPVAVAARRMRDPHGACVHVQATTHRGDHSADRLPYRRPPHAQIDELVRAYLGPVRRAGQGHLSGGSPSGEAEILRSTGFAGPDRVELATAEVVVRNVDDIVAATFSLSRAAPHLFGARAEDFERDLRRLLRRSSPVGRFAERTRTSRSTSGAPLDPFPGRLRSLSRSAAVRASRPGQQSLDSPISAGRRVRRTLRRPRAATAIAWKAAVPDTARAMSQENESQSCDPRGPGRLRYRAQRPQRRDGRARERRHPTPVAG
jgi:hypothetical protein